MNKFESLKLVFVFLIIPSFVIAQQEQKEGRIEGTIISENRSIIGYASIRVFDYFDSTKSHNHFSDGNGSFSVKLSYGKYFLQIQYIGYYSIQLGPFVLTDSSNNITLGKIIMSENLKSLTEVRVSSRKPFLETIGNKTIINVGNSILGSGKSAYDILTVAPGININRDGNVTLRGKEGANVLVNGKQTFLSSAQLYVLLKSTDGSTVETIEIITNPSSKYDASGNAGIINIKLKKSKTFGTNGTLVVGGGYGSFHKYNGGISLNHRQKHINVFGNVNVSNEEMADDIKIDRVNTFNNTKTIFQEHNIQNTKMQNFAFGTGLDYYFNDNNVLGVEVGGYYNKWNLNTASNTKIGNTMEKPDSIVVGRYPGNSKYPKISYNLNFKSKFDTTGKEINIDFVVLKYNNRQFTEYLNNFYDYKDSLLRPPVVFKNLFPSVINVFTSKLDYIHPLTKTIKLEFGWKGSWVKTDNNSKFEKFNGIGYSVDSSLSDYFIYKESINAAYLNFTKSSNTSTIQFGLRAEHTDMNATSVNLNRRIVRAYLNLFPSFNYNQTVSEKNQIGFSFSRRIDRPNYGYLNPFQYYIDLYTVVRGNPYLNPQFTNSFEFYYSYNKKLNVTMNYSRTENVMTDIIGIDSVNKTIFQTKENFAKQNYFSVNINSPLVIRNWWSGNINFVIYYNNYKSENLFNYSFNRSIFSFRLNASNTIKIDSTLNLEFAASYQSKEISGPILYHPYFNLDIGVSKSILQKRALLKLSVNDIFNTLKFHSSSLIEAINYNVYMKGETRIFKIIFQYNFGSNKITSVRSKIKGAVQEEGRAQ